MTAFLIHLAGLGIVWLWYRRRRQLPLGVLFALWWAGLLLMRTLPGFLAGRVAGSIDFEQHRGIAALFASMSWVGALLMLRALLGLVLMDRPPSRRLRVFTGLMFIGLVMIGVAPKLDFLWITLAACFFWSFRWRARLSAKWLALATASGLISIFLAAISFGRNPADWTAVVPGFAALPSVLTGLAGVYAFVAMFAAASRVHLSIRRIGPRLIGSHLLAGLIPFILAATFLLLSGALFLATYRGSVGLRLIEDQSAQACARIARALDTSGDAPRDPFGGDEPGQAVLMREGSGAARVLQGSVRFPPDSLLAQPDTSAKVPFLWDGSALFLRARVDRVKDGRPLRVEALAPVDSARMGWISRILGVPARVSPHVEVHHTKGGIQIGGAEESSDTVHSPQVIGPSGAAPRGLPGGAIVRCLRWTGKRWAHGSVPLSSSAGFGEQILSLFHVAKENVLATLVLFALGALAALFLGALWVASAMVLEMGRSITHAVRALTTATGALRQGHLDHRIAVEGQDELWSVAASFNVMAEDLQKMRAMELETQRLEEELRLARVIQDRLLPAGPPLLERAELAGLSLPAREVGGDYYDYLTLDGGLLGVAVADVSGKGAPAALLMSTFRASLRSQDLALLGPAEALARINRFIHSSIDPGRFITAFLGLLDPASGEFRYANAGHDAPMIVRPDGTTGELSGGGLILGMLPQIIYEEASATLEPGALVAIYTDGVTEARDPSGDFYGSERLAEVLCRRRGESCSDLLRHVVDSIEHFNASEPQSDDITLVLIRRR